MALMRYPRSRIFARLSAMFSIIFFVVFGIDLYRTGESFAGIVLFGMAGILVLGVAVFSMDWFQNLDQSLRIFQVIIVTSVIGGAAGPFLRGLEGAVFGWTYTFLGAQLAGAVSALLFRYRDEREEREYETEMRKYGKEP